MRINPVLASLGANPMAEIHQKANELAATGEPMFNFSIGDPREPTASFIRQALLDNVPEISQYPSAGGLPQTRRAIAEYVERRFGTPVDPDAQVTPTAGLKEAVFTSPLAFVDRAARDVVIYATPGYPVYEAGARMAGAETYQVTLEGDFLFAPDMVPDPIWERAAMVWINTPHNPSGSVMRRSDLEAFYTKARSTDTLIFSDECYVDLYEGEPPASVLQVSGPDFAGVVSLLSLSKRSGMTGYRAGAMVGDARAIAALRNLRTSTGTLSQEFTQAAAVEAWSDDEHVAPRREIFAAKRAVLRDVFEDCGYETVASQAGLYLWVRVGDDMAMAERLLEHRVVASPGSVFGPGGEGYMRFALVPTLEECKKAVEVLRVCLTKQ